MRFQLILAFYLIPKFIYRRLGFFPSRYSIRLLTIRQNQAWKDLSAIRRVLVRWYDQRRPSVAVLVLLILTVLVSLVLDFAIDPLGWGEVPYLWQIYATIVGLSFIVIVFLLDFVSRSRYAEAVLTRIVKKSYVRPVMYYSLLGTVLIGILYLYPSLRLGGMTPNLPASFLIVTVGGIIFVYSAVFKLMLNESPRTHTYKILKEGLTSALDADRGAYRYDDVWSDRIPEHAEIEESGYAPAPSDKKPVTASELDLQGHIVDINYREFNAALKNISPSEGGSPDDDKSIIIRGKLGQNVDDFPTILYVDRTLDIPLTVLDQLSNSILTRTKPLWSHNLRRLYRLIDFVERDGKNTVREGQSGTFSRFLINYEDVTHHLFGQISEHRYLLDEHRIGRGDLPIDYFGEVLSRIFEETLIAQDRRMAISTIQTLHPIIRDCIDNDLFVFYSTYVEKLSNFYLRLCLRRAELSDIFSSAIIDELLHVLDSVARECIVKDLDDLASFDDFELRIESYALPLFQEVHRMFKYAIEADDHRMFWRLWSELSIPPDHENESVKDQFRTVLAQIRFNAAALAYSVALQNDERRGLFDEIYNGCIVRHYHELAPLFDAYSATMGSNRYPDWSNWQRQEHDLIQGQFGKPISLNEGELKDFYCFVGILSAYHPDDTNPLEGKPLTEKEFRQLRIAVEDLKRDPPLLEISEHVDEEKFEEQADRFLEYHEEIAASDTDG